MLLPVTMDNAERIVETIQEIKEKIPADPFEAELIFMAEMVAEDNEKNGKEQTSKNKVEKENEKQEASAPYGEKKKHFINTIRLNSSCTIYRLRKHFLLNRLTISDKRKTDIYIVC